MAVADRRIPLKEQIVSFILSNAGVKGWTQPTDTYPALEKATGKSRQALYSHRLLIAETLSESKANHAGSNGHSSNGHAAAQVALIKEATEAPAEQQLFDATPTVENFTMAQRLLLDSERRVALLNKVLKALVNGADEAETLRQVVSAILENA